MKERMLEQASPMTATAEACLRRLLAMRADELGANECYRLVRDVALKRLTERQKQKLASEMMRSLFQ